MTFTEDELDVIREALRQYEQRLDDLADRGGDELAAHLRGAGTARRIRARIDAVGPRHGLVALVASISARFQA